MKKHLSTEIRVHAEASPANTARLTDALSRGFHLPVKVEGTDLIGFAVRLDDAPFGPVAVVHIPHGEAIRVCYLDPEELQILEPATQIRQA